MPGRAAAKVWDRTTPGIARVSRGTEGDLTVLADGRVAPLTPDEEVHGLGALLAALVGEPPDALGDRHERLNSAGLVPLARRTPERGAVG